MRVSALRPFLVALALEVALFVMARPARAQPTGLPAVIHVDAPELTAARVQSAIERELKVLLVIDPGARERLDVDVNGRRASVSYYAPEREPVTRSVDLPRDPERALETIAFLAGNLARDEASELLAELAPAPGSEPDSVPRPEPPPAPPAPAPAPAATAPPPAAALAKSAQPALLESDKFAANFSIYHPVGALKHTERRRLNLELGLAYSWVGAIHGAAMTLGYFRSDGLVQGYSAAVGWNRSGPVKGAQLAGLVNEGYGELRGLSFASLVNQRDGDVRGAQGASIVARSGLTFGLQASAVVAVAREVQGVQAGFVAAVAGPVEGAQLGLVNVAGALRGFQLGLVNRAGPVNGLQVGLVNVAGDVHGGAVGLLSVAKNGRVQPSVWFAGPNPMLFVGIRSVTDLTYNLLAVGYDPVHNRVGHQESIGAHLDVAGLFFVEPGVGYGAMYDNDVGGGPFTDSSLHRSEVRFDLRVGAEPWHRFTPFIGGALTRRIRGNGHEATYRGELSLGMAFL
jgi:hypothetical protein